VAPEGLTTLGQFANGIEKFFLWVAIPLVGLAIIAGAVVLLTSFGIPERINLGKRIMTWAGAGLIIVLIGVGIGEVMGEKEMTQVTQYTPVSKSVADGTREYVSFLQTQAKEYKTFANEAKASGKTDDAKAYEQRAGEMENIAAPLVLALANVDTLDKNYTDADTKYKFIDKTVKELSSLSEKWSKISASEKTQFNSGIHTDYILPLVNYGVLPQSYKDANASSNWISVLEKADLKRELNAAFHNREILKEKAEINSSYITNPTWASYKYGSDPNKAISL
jgi:rubrerythrin